MTPAEFLLWLLYPLAIALAASFGYGRGQSAGWREATRAFEEEFNVWLDRTIKRTDRNARAEQEVGRPDRPA